MSPAQRIQIHPARLTENIRFLDDFLREKSMTWTFVIKAFEGLPAEIFDCLRDVPCASVASAQIDVLRDYKRLHPQVETWWLNYEGVACDQDWIDINLTHAPKSKRDCYMVLLDPLREGCEGEFVQDAIDRGTCNCVGAYLDCAAMPDASFLSQWRQFGFDSSITQSLGTSVSFGEINRLQEAGVNHYRIGELAITGLDLITRQPIPGLRQDVVTPVAAQSALFH